MTLVYVTAKAPFGNCEQFILSEIINIVNSGYKVICLPIRPEKLAYKGEESTIVAQYSIRMPLFSISILLIAFITIIQNPLKFLKIIFNIVRYSGDFNKIIKNFIVLPKGLVSGYIFKNEKVEHIHAHWASTTSTVAYIASYISEIPWSLTTHRWDIAENNMLKEKVRTAKFVRAINKRGYNEILSIIGNKLHEKCVIIHCGTEIPRLESKPYINKKKFVIGVPANLIEVKGHKFLLEALKLLDTKIEIECNIFGDGPLKKEINLTICKYNLQNRVFIKGSIPHNELLSLYKKGCIDCVILPSIETDNGEKEGIPVSLIEAMAYGIPVISTNTGGIPELLNDGAGIIVQQKNPREIANAIISLINNRALYKNICEKGYDRVYKKFNISNVVNKMISCMNT